MPTQKPTQAQNPAPLLDICIVSYNTRDLTLQTLRSVIADLRRSPDLYESHQVVVIDNNSQDDTVPEVEKLIKKNTDIKIKIIANTKNLGFAKANNQAIETSRGKYILLLNSDTIVQAGALAKLVFSMENFSPGDTVAETSQDSEATLDKIGVVSATLINWDGTHQPQGGDLPNLLTIFTQQLFLDDIPLIGKFVPSVQKTGRSAKTVNFNDLSPNQKPREVGWVGGTAMLLRRAMIDEIGGLDENIFMYGEDIELCLRAQNHHWRVAIHPTARITHFQSASSSPKNAILGEIKGLLYIWSKQKPIWQYKFAKAILTIGSFLRVNTYRLSTNQDKITAYEEALDYLKSQSYA